MQRWLGAVFLSGVITFASFYGMALMISGSHDKPTGAGEESMMNFIRVQRSPDLDTRNRKKPEPPKQPKTPPKMPKMNVAANTPTPTQTPQMDLPNFDIPLGLSGGPALSAAMDSGAQNTDVTPIVRIEPNYPRKAAMAGVEGWVKLSFDISSLGTVENVEVLDANPKRIFDREAIRSLLKWKYKPRVIDGKAQAQKDNKVQIDFKLRG